MYTNNIYTNYLAKPALLLLTYVLNGGLIYLANKLDPRDNTNSHRTYQFEAFELL